MSFPENLRFLVTVGVQSIVVSQLGLELEGLGLGLTVMFPKVDRSWC